jgi:hypothetical protein
MMPVKEYSGYIRAYPGYMDTAGVLYLAEQPEDTFSCEEPLAAILNRDSIDYGRLVAITYRYHHNGPSYSIDGVLRANYRTYYEEADEEVYFDGWLEDIMVDGIDLLAEWKKHLADEPGQVPEYLWIQISYERKEGA